jgi:hypothetical protein
MTHPLDGPDFKVRCAKREIERLARLEDEFQDEADYKLIRAEHNPKTRDDVYRVLVNVLPPPDLGVLIGEIAHNLRSALDGLIYQLARLNPGAGDAPTGTQFPIFLSGTPSGCKRRLATGRRGKTMCADPRHFNCLGMKWIGLLLAKHQAAIELLQPYKRGGGHASSPLYLLSEINNADKHRLLQVIGVKPHGYIWGKADDETAFPDISALNAIYEDAKWPFIKMLEDGAKVIEISPRVHVQSDVIPSIAFYEGCAAVYRRPILITLRRIADHVSEIVESFRPEFG